MLKAVIFDMDGVIIDSEPFHLEVNKKLFKKLGLSISEDEYSTYIGVSNPEMWTKIKELHGINQSVDDLSKMQLDAIMEYLKGSDEKPIPGIKELLTYLKKNHIRIGLASSSPLELIERILEMFEIRNYFHVVMSGQNVPNGKPAPDIFQNVAQKLKVNPEDSVVIEDSKNGVIAAKAAGMKCIGYKNPGSGNQDISAADLVIDNFECLEFSDIEKLYVY
jgi:beta-phosphoglucomutase family hydrolase